MSTSQGTKHPLKKKIAVALAMLQQKNTVAQICSTHQVHATQASTWKQKALRAIETYFDGNPKLEKQLREKDDKISEVYRQLGKANVEIEYLKKNLGIAC